MANPNENRIDTVITDADVTSIAGGFTTIGNKLNAYLMTLTQDERDSFFSVAEENQAFSDDALEQGLLLNAQFPVMVQNVVANMVKDTKLAQQLETMENTQINPLAQGVKDTKRLANHERYVAALAIYKMIEMGAGMGMTGFQAAYDVLKGRFANQGGRPPGGNNP